MDFGCGTGALSFAFSDSVKEILYVDVPNLAQDFLLWRIKKYSKIKKCIVTTPQMLNYNTYDI